MALLRSLVILVALLVAPVSSASAQGVPVPPLTGPVIDQVGVLNPQQRTELEQELWALKKEKGSEIAVLIVPSTRPEEIEQYSIRVVDTWKLGRKGIDDGVLLLVALNDRRVRIEVGRGLEGDIPDVKAFRVIDELIVPQFKRGDVAGGVTAGARALEGLIRGVDLPTPKPSGKGASELSFYLVVFGYVIGALLETIAGLLVAAGVGGIVTVLIGAFLFVPAVAVTLGCIVVVLVLILGGGRYRSGWSAYGGTSSYGDRYDGSGSGGAFGGGSFGGGGSFSGGGSSGRW